MPETTTLLGETRVLIVYESRFGALQAMAEQVVEGVRSVAHTDVRLLRIGDDSVTSRKPRRRCGFCRRTY